MGDGTPKGAVSINAMIAREKIDDLAFTVLRIGAGIIVLPHGVSQLVIGHASLASSALAVLGVWPSPMASYLIVYLELFGGACVLFGLFTRAFAVALSIETLWVAAVFWANPTGLHDEFEPWEFPLVLAVVLLLISAMGSGPYSLDRMLAKR